MEEQDKLYEAAKFFKDNLENKRFHLKAGNKQKKLIEFDIQFTANNFKHLTGLHKLTDVPQFKRKSSRLYNDILNKEITEKDIFQSEKLTDETIKRIEHFQVLKDILQDKRIMIRSVDGQFFKIPADYMITKSDVDKQYAHLFLKRNDGNQSITFPVTFIIEPSTLFLGKKEERWTVLSIEEVKKTTLSKKTNPIDGKDEEHEHER